MCLISNYAYKSIFCRESLKLQNGITPDGLKLMSPDFEGYLRDQSEAIETLLQYPFEDWELAAQDGTPMRAKFYRNGDSEKTLVWIHGYASTGIRDAAAVGLEYIRAGFNLLLPDNRACGDSGGSVMTFGILESRDSADWIRKLSELRSSDSICVHGCSMGAAAVCILASKELPPAVRAFVSDCAFSDIADQIAHTIRIVAGVPSFPIYNLTAARFRKINGFSLDSESPLDSVAHSRLPILFIHGGLDRYVPPANAEKLYAACSAPKELFIVGNAGHAASYRFDRKGYASAVFSFLDRYM